MSTEISQAHSVYGSRQHNFLSTSTMLLRRSFHCSPTLLKIVPKPSNTVFLYNFSNQLSAAQVQEKIAEYHPIHIKTFTMEQKFDFSQRFPRFYFPRADFRHKAMHKIFKLPNVPHLDLKVDKKYLNKLAIGEIWFKLDQTEQENIIRICEEFRGVNVSVLNASALVKFRYFYLFFSKFMLKLLERRCLYGKGAKEEKFSS